MSWLIEGENYVIQGVGEFDTSKMYPVNIQLAISGDIEISLENLENLEAGIELFIKDNLTLRHHKINDNPFELTLAAGDYLDRFSLVFSHKKNTEHNPKDRNAIGDDDILENDVQVFMNNETSEIKIKRPIEIEFKSIELYNTIGQKIQSWNKNLNYRKFTLPVNVATGVYLIKIKTATGTVSKKVIIEY